MQEIIFRGVQEIFSGVQEFRSSGVTLRLGVQTIVSTMMHTVGAETEPHASSTFV